MIYTLTMNPSIDYVVDVDGFAMGKTNRSSREQMLAGGKGINVSTVLTHLGLETTALGFVAGFVGEEICRMVENLGVKTEFFRLSEGNSRINVKFRNAEGTEINAAGPNIPREQLALLWNKLSELKEEDVLILAGSVPPSVGQDLYEEVMKKLMDRGTRIVVDASKELLKKVLPYHPFLIKPNGQELSELFGMEIKSKEDAVPYAIKLREMGARNVLVSLGGQGAVLISEEGTAYMSEAPKGVVKNAVGAGDSMVAGFLAGYFTKQDYGYALKMGLAAGSASAFSEQLATQEEIEKLLEQIV